MARRAQPEDRSAAGPEAAGPAAASPEAAGPAAASPEAGGREHLTRPRVVAAALQIVDRDGLDALTMRALGRELGVDPMAAYHWFPNKLAILQGVSEAILSEITADGIEETTDWIEVGRKMATEYRTALLRHPNAIPVASTQPVMTPRGFELIERLAARMVKLGWTPGGALEVINTIAAFVIGVCVVQAGVTPGSEPVTEEKIMEVYSAIDVTRFPTLAAAVSELGEANIDDEAQFERATEAMLFGLDQVFRARGLLS
jgi:TetR/AcrR family tetracycline transcriptional repressor